MRDFTPLVTPEEAVNLAMLSNYFVPAIPTVKGIARFSESYYYNEFTGSDHVFIHACVLYAVFEAGRVQGIREERRRKAERKKKYEV